MVSEDIYWVSLCEGISIHDILWYTNKGELILICSAWRQDRCAIGGNKSLWIGEPQGKLPNKGVMESLPPLWAKSEHIPGIGSVSVSARGPGGECVSWCCLAICCLLVFSLRSMFWQTQPREVNTTHRWRPSPSPPTMLANVMSTWHKLVSSKRRKPQLRKCLYNIGL